MMNLANPSSYKGMDFFLDDDSLDELDEIDFKNPNLIQAPLPTYNTDSQTFKAVNFNFQKLMPYSFNEFVPREFPRENELRELRHGSLVNLESFIPQSPEGK